MHLLGALNSVTRTYTPPELATKDASYVCPECSKPVILRKGNVRVAHFAHKTSTDPCAHYNRPGESQMHKDAKHRLQALLNAGYTLNISYKCSGYHCMMLDYPAVKYITISLFEGDTVVLEYREKSGAYVADLAVVRNGEPRIILEVRHTHATTTDIRPEPWYEIGVEDVLDMEFPTDPKISIHFMCTRSRKGWDRSGKGRHEVCWICTNSESLIGAFDAPSGGYCLPLEDYKDNMCICLDCKQPVKLLCKRVFVHITDTLCTMYTYPTEKKKTKDLLLKLARIFQKSTIKSLMNVCNCEYCVQEYIPTGRREVLTHCDTCMGVTDLLLPSEKTTYKTNIKNRSLTIVDEKVMRYIFTICLTTTNLPPKPIGENTYHIHEDEILRIINIIDIENCFYDTIFTCYTDLHCEECTLFQTNLPKIISVPCLLGRDKIPHLTKKYGGEREWRQEYPCIGCGRYSYNPVFDRGFRQICKLCIDTFTYIPQPCIQCKSSTYDPVIYKGLRAICRPCVLNLKK